jgi:KUP system potassium uptake protein
MTLGLLAAAPLAASESDTQALVPLASQQGGRIDVGVSQRTTAQAALAVGALGVVFGDLGTSPLYTEQTVFNPGDPHPVRVSTENIFGIVSLIFWSVTIIVTVTYVWLVMRADNDGEGGIMALITLIRRRGVTGGRRAAVVLAALEIFGASLFFGDSMITPAISVLSAIEGVKVAAPSLSDLVVPISAEIETPSMTTGCPTSCPVSR